MYAPEVDFVVLSRDDELDSSVLSAIAAQEGVLATVHHVIGTALPTDQNRWETISRARNRGKSVGGAPWLMFVDDDVLLDPRCARTLIDEIRRRPFLGALGADYLDESDQEFAAGHVGMGAALFRRSALDLFEFRWESDRCECQCCCDDLRQIGLGIAYSRSAQARHLTGEAEAAGSRHRLAESRERPGG